MLITKGKGGQPLYARLWGSGFLPRAHQGVQFLPRRRPVLYLEQSRRASATAARRQLLDRLRELHQR